MVREASLTEDDLAEVDRCRRDHNRLGFAYQIGFVRLFRRFPAQHPLEICDELLSFVAAQLNIDATRLEEYAARQPTVSDHQTRIRDYLKLATFDPEQAKALDRFVFEESCRLEQTASLLARAREFLKERSVLFPAESSLLRLVAEQKKRAREHIVSRLAEGLAPGVVKALDDILEVKEGEAISGLQTIKANPAKPSPSAMQSLADKLAAIEATGVLAVDLSWLNANYQRALFHYVRKCSADRLREVARPRRLASLACFLRQSYRDAVDQAVDMFDKFLTRAHTRAEHELDDQMRSQRQTIKAALAALRSLGAIILDDSVDNVALRPRLFAAVPRDALEAQMAGLDEWVTGKKCDVFHGLVRRFSHLRQFSPVLLRDLAEAHRKLGQPAEVAGVARELRHLWAGDPGEMYDIACQWALCIPIAGTGSTSDKDEAARRRGFVDQAMEALRQAITAGFRDFELMRKDADLDALRSHTGFQELLMDSGFPSNPFAR